MRDPLSVLRRARPLRASCGAAVLAASLLAGCGDSEFAQTFQANRVVAFGDEASVILDDGRKYSVNDFTAGTLDCTKNPIWVQELATNLRRPMQVCPGTAPANNPATSITRAAPGATVDSLRQQLDAHLASDTLGDKDVVTMFVGKHDILQEYAAVAADGESVVASRLETRGKALGAQVNRIAQAGSPVLVVTVPDIGRTPLGIAEEQANAGRAAMLARLTSRFNTAMRLEIINDGRMIGLVDASDLFGAMFRFPGNYGLSNITDAACLSTVALPSCSTQTLIQNIATSNNSAPYVWADSLNFGATAHRYLSIVAISRANNNPF